jgi:hypothetical protein
MNSRQSHGFGMCFERTFQSLCEYKIFFCGKVCEGSLNLPQKRKSPLDLFRRLAVIPARPSSLGSTEGNGIHSASD